MNKFFPVLTLSFCLIMIVLASSARPQPPKGGKGGPPPAPVETAETIAGSVEPMEEFVGSVRYSRVSEVASEVSGKVVYAPPEEGRRVKAGDVLVRLDSTLLNASIRSRAADYEAAVAGLEKSRKDLSRLEPLFKEGSISASAYDDSFYGAKAAEQKAKALEAELEQLKIDKGKKTVRSPFSGIVVVKSVEEGEWVSPGVVVAAIGDDGLVDAVVDVPEGVTAFLERGRRLKVISGGKSFVGDFFSVVPRGDIATRTFTAKIRIENKAGLMEGMEARAVLPVGPKSEGLMVPRDAVLDKFGRNVVFAVSDDSTAIMIPVEITGYSGMLVGVRGEGLSAGLKVVVKGNERLRDGQPVSELNDSSGPGQEGR